MNCGLRPVHTETKRFTDYEEFTSQLAKKEEIYKRANSLRGYKVAHINATESRGGVAETLRYLIPLMNDLGVETSWYVMRTDSNLSRISKLTRDYLQGKQGGSLASYDKDYYLSYSRGLAAKMELVGADIWIVHDYQPLAAFSFLKNASFKKIWYCHIDILSPNKQVWAFFLQYLDKYNHFIFLSKDFIPKEISSSQSTIITPAIDPLAKKNIVMKPKKAKRIVSSFGIDIGKPLVTQVARFDRWKDPQGVIDAYRLAKAAIPDLQLAFVAKVAINYPEVEKETKDIRRYAQGDKNIHFIVNAKNNDQVVNAFQTGSDVIIHKSIREGFGQSVTEAMWKDKAVIGGDAVGIRAQINSGINGFMVKDSEECASRIIELIYDSKLRRRIGLVAHKTVKEHFLLPRLILDYLRLFNKLVKG